MSGFGSRSSASNGDGVLVVVHPAGRLDDFAAAIYWTEVPSLPACYAEGSSVDEVLDLTRAAIEHWTRGAELRVEFAF